MNVIRCKNLHYFDGDTYEKCPHCGEGVYTGESKPVVKEEKKGLWGKNKKEKEEIDHTEKVSDDAKTEAAQFTKETSTNDNPTVDFWQAEPKNGDEAASVEIVKEEEKVTDEIQFVEEQKTEQVEESQPSLKEAIKNASASNEGKTMSYFSTASASSVASTEKPVSKGSSEPIVGWLVCIKGIHLGDAFIIYSGKNSIGRSDDNRIVITGDNSISRSKHAFIVYEPKKRNFYLQPGDSSGLTYLNEEYITESKLLSSKDVIELGESKFIFIPLCGQDFSWEEYI